MTSRHRKRKAPSSRQDRSWPPTPSPNPDLVESCMAAILPTIRETVQNVLLNHTTSQPQECQSQPTQLNSFEMEATSLQLITDSGNPGISSTSSLSAQEPGIAKPVALGIDPKIK